MVRLFDAGLREDRPVVVHDRVWTVANGITFVRLLGLPLIVWLLLGADRPGLAFAVIAGVATTDWIDGYVARRFDQVTKLGRTLDPVIDRALLVTVGVTLAIAGILPWYVLAAIALRDVTLALVYAALFRGVPEIPVTRTGKFGTACLLVGIPSFLVRTLDWSGQGVADAFTWIFTVPGVVAYYIAGAQYLRAAWRLRATGDGDAQTPALGSAARASGEEQHG